MSIKRIKNLKYSPSKMQLAAKWADVNARKYKLLADSDWTQLPDVNLTEFTKNRWANWRGRLRGLKRENHESIDGFKRELKLIESDRESLYIEYKQESPRGSLESNKMFLNKLLNNLYKASAYNSFEPNLEERYQEVLDISTHLIAANEPRDTDISDFTIAALIGFINSLTFGEFDVSPYPFVELTMNIQGYTLQHAMIHILTMKQDQYNFSLQEEYKLLHYTNVIDSCVTHEDIIRAKVDIESAYGH